MIGWFWVDEKGEFHKPGFLSSNYSIGKYPGKMLRVGFAVLLYLNVSRNSWLNQGKILFFLPGWNFMITSDVLGENLSVPFI